MVKLRNVKQLFRRLWILKRTSNTHYKTGKHLSTSVFSCKKYKSIQLITFMHHSTLCITVAKILKTVKLLYSSSVGLLKWILLLYSMCEVVKVCKFFFTTNLTNVDSMWSYSVVRRLFVCFSQVGSLVFQEWQKQNVASQPSSHLQIWHCGGLLGVRFCFLLSSCHSVS